MKNRNLLKLFLILGIILVSILFILFLNLLNIYDSCIEILYGIIIGSIGYMIWHKLDFKINA